MRGKLDVAAFSTETRFLTVDTPLPVSVVGVRQNFSRLIREVSTKGKVVDITRHGKVMASIVDAEVGARIRLEKQLGNQPVRDVRKALMRLLARLDTEIDDQIPIVDALSYVLLFLRTLNHTKEEEPPQEQPLS